MSVRHAKFRLRPKNRSEEHERQKHCTTMLRAYMPADVWWCASLSGVPLSPHLAAIAKSAGLQRGAPDYSFIFPDGRTKYIEMKAPGGELTDEQAMLLARLGSQRMVVCHSWLEMRVILLEWLAHYGLRLLTDAESVRREAERRRAQMAAKILKQRPLRRRVERASTA